MSQALLNALDELELALRQLDCWHSQSPALAALRSQVPFAADSLSFPQWLQFILLPKLRVLVIDNQPLPQAQITPAAQVLLSPPLYAELAPVLARIDELLP